jgi:hypothetical protein
VSPLILFYRLNQAARALSAARISSGDWEPPWGHGLALPKPDLRDDCVPALGDIKVRDDGRGFLEHVADLLDSPTLSVETTLATHVCSLPEHREFLLNLDEPRPLDISIRSFGRTPGPSDTFWLAVGALPDDMLELETRPDV